MYNKNLHNGTVQLFNSASLFLSLLVEVFIDLSLFPQRRSSESLCPASGLQQMLFSTERMMCCSLLMSCLVSALFQTILHHVRTDSMMALQSSVNTAWGRLRFFSWLRKNILTWVFLVMELMLMSQVPGVVPRNLNSSIVATVVLFNVKWRKG